MSYWLKGGIIGLIVGILLTILLIVFSPTICGQFISEVESVYQSQGIACNYNLIKNLFLAIPVISALIGVIIGFIVGKIKQNKNGK